MPVILIGDSTELSRKPREHNKIDQLKKSWSLLDFLGGGCNLSLGEKGIYTLQNRQSSAGQKEMQM